ncbi:MAG TPA: hypothetical protein VMI54_29810 [Polyangiaceae bacterium]|nr:hypothetical protein [Polyangiaceae bacterium]
MRRSTPVKTRGLGRSLAWASVFGALVWSAPAGAEPTFPAALQKEFKNQCAVQCTLCHTSPEGGLDNLKPSPISTGPVALISPNRGTGEFFANLIRIGANGGSPHYPASDDALIAMVKLLETTPCDKMMGTPCDSDGDGTIDTKELAEDEDPDVIDKPGDYCLGPKYGCGAHIGNIPRESSATREAAAVISLLGVGLVFLRRARRR